MANNTAQSFVPFFTATVLFKNDKAPAGAYDCVACGNDIGEKNTPAAISYKNDYLGQWAHPACLMKAKIIMTDDRKAKKAAQAVHRDAFQASYQNKAKTTTTVSSSPAQTTVKTQTTTPPAEPDLGTTSIAEGFMKAQTELRATIEAEYEARLTAMVSIIQAKNERIATLESDNEKLAMELSRIIVTSVSDDQRTKNARMNDSALTPQELGRCGAPKKDGTACRWDTSKTACMHHNRAA